MYEDPPNSSPKRRRIGIGLGVTLAGAGLTAGVILASAFGASAATNGTASTASQTSAASSTGSTSSSTAGTSSTTPGRPGGPGGGYRVPALSGTVTAVGSNSVTIKTSSGTKTYQVTSSSDIDKNGEAKLSDLVVGDAVRYNVMSSSSTTIDKLHAGNEAQDRPAAPPAGAAQPGNGAPPAHA